MKIIGIGGTNGSGKDTLSDILANDYGWLFVSTSRDLLIPELKKRGLPIERKNMAALGAEWRRETGTSVIIDKAIKKFKTESKQRIFNGLVISSLRHPWEIDRVHELGGKIVWLDADPKIRYNRIYDRGQGAKDKKTYEQFLAEERTEMNHVGGDKTTLSSVDVKARADIFLTNDTDNVKDFEKAAQQALNL